MPPLLLLSSASYAERADRPVVAIGNFDGVHLGHQSMLAEAIRQAVDLGRPTLVYTFDPPPAVVLRPGTHYPRILPLEDRVRLLADFGVDQVCIEPFSYAFAQHLAKWFAQEILQRRFNPSAIVVGYDFRFGQNRQGDFELLKTALPSVSVSQVSAFEKDGEVVSSSRIRRLVSDGNVRAASEMLSRRHTVRGTVVTGDQRGRELGFPTANLATPAELLPAPGVYVVEGCVDRRRRYGGVANLGVRPTFSGNELQIEIHLFDLPPEEQDLYGRELEVEFVEKLREEKRFANADQLRHQIASDAADARALLADAK